MSFDAVRGTNGGALTVVAACYDGSVRGFVHGEEGEGQEGGARVPQWSLQFLEQDKVCVCVCVCARVCVRVCLSLLMKCYSSSMCMSGVSTSNFYTGSETR